MRCDGDGYEGVETCGGAYATPSSSSSVAAAPAPAAGFAVEGVPPAKYGVGRFIVIVMFVVCTSPVGSR